MKKTISFLLISVIITLNIASTAYADWTQYEVLTASDGVDDDHFGLSTRVYGDYLVTGAYFNDGDAGSAYVFEYDGSNYIEKFKLIASDRTADDNFANMVAIHGDYIIIGAKGEDENGSEAGAAYVFKKEGDSDWGTNCTGTNPIVCEEDQKLLASDGEAGDNFGYWISQNGNYALISAQGDDDNGDHAGAAYIFENQSGTWVEMQKIKPSDGTIEDNFGEGSHSITDQYAIIAAIWDDEVYENSGSVYVFENQSGTWTQIQKITANDPYQATPPQGDSFGIVSYLFNDTLFIGKQDENLKGKIEVFENIAGTWTYDQTIVPSDPENYSFFGHYVNARGEYLTVGAFNKNSGEGAIYIFKNIAGTWTEQQKLTPINPPPGTTALGFSTVIDQNYQVIGGAHAYDNNQGAVYVFNNTDLNNQVPEFKYYIYIITLILGFALLIKTIPAIKRQR